MPRERARTREAPAGAAVRVDRQLEGRPRDRGPELHPRPPLDGPRRWNAHAAADRLDEPHGRRTDLGLLLDVRQVNGRESDGRGSDPDGGRADFPATEVAVADDPAVLHIDIGPQLVGLPKPVSLAKG